MSIANNFPKRNMHPDEQLKIVGDTLRKIGQPLAGYPLATNHSSLPGYLRRLGPLPPYSAVLGQCSDGLPMCVDLSETAAILVVGDETLELLPRALVYTAAQLNHPDRVAFTVITPGHAFDDLLHLPHCEDIISAYDSRSVSAIVELAAVAEQRKSGRERGPVHVLVIDDLWSLLAYNDYQTSVYLLWLVEYGPRLGVVPVASARAADVAAIQTQEPRLLPAFGERIAAIVPEYQAALRGGGTIRFRPLEV